MCTSNGSLRPSAVSPPESRAGAAGWKRLDYDVAIVFLYKSQLRDSEAAMDGYDTFVEAIKARLRADPRLGQPTRSSGKPVCTTSKTSPTTRSTTPHPTGEQSVSTSPK